MNHVCVHHLFKDAKRILLSFMAFSATYTGSALAGAAQVRGQVGAIWDYQSDLGIQKSRVLGNRLPFSLQLEAKPSDKVSVTLGLVYAANAYPTLAPQMGSGGPSTPFLSPAEGGRGEKFKELVVDRAFVSYDSDFGFFQVGRLPRHWGLGLVRNSEWQPGGGTISFSDSISGTWDFDAFRVSLFWEKSLASSLTSKNADFDGFTVEATLVGDPLDADDKGFQRSLGLSFSQLSQNSTSTKLMLLDLYTRFHWPRFLLETEIYYPSGKTKNPGYRLIGGLGPCEQGSLETCNSQSVQAFGGLFKTSWASFEGGGLQTIAGLMLAHERGLPTSQRPKSHIVTLMAGGASGSKGSFGESEDKGSIGSIPLHPNIRPSLLMFSPHLPFIQGMPGSLVQNSVFLKGEYTFESSHFGALTPQLVWASLHRTNKSTSSTPLGDGQNPSEKGLGRFKNLGVELDVAYKYVTQDRVELGAVGGIWLPGKAWESFSHEKPQLTYGLRTYASVTF